MRPGFLLAAALVAAIPHGVSARGRNAHPVLAGPDLPPTNPYAQCDVAIQIAARAPAGLPATLLPAIARVESGRLDPATGRVRSWPWTINVDGVGYFFDTKEDVVATVQQLQARGKKSIDVGCMQVNLMHHPDAFTDLDDAFDPQANARYAVQFLLSLYQTTKDWPLAAAYYHSSTPDLGEEYQRLVFGRVMTPMGGSGGLKPNAPSDNWPPAGERFAAIPPASVTFGALAAPLIPQTPIHTAFAGIPALTIGSYPNLFQARSLGPLPGAKHKP